MLILFTCRYCGRVLNAPAELAGRRAKCPHCSNIVLVPGAPPKRTSAEAKPVLKLLAALSRAKRFGQDNVAWFKLGGSVAAVVFLAAIGVLLVSAGIRDGRF